MLLPMIEPSRYYDYSTSKSLCKFQGNVALEAWFKKRVFRVTETKPLPFRYFSGLICRLMMRKGKLFRSGRNAGIPANPANADAIRPTAAPPDFYPHAPAWCCVGIGDGLERSATAPNSSSQSGVAGRSNIADDCSSFQQPSWFCGCCP